MDLTSSTWLVAAVFSPLAIALLILLLPSDSKVLTRWVAFILSFVPLIFVLIMWFNYDRIDPGFQFDTGLVEWFPAIGSSFHMGVDGISLPMMLLTAILTPLAILASFNIEDRPKMYMFLFLLLETAMLGLFATLDLIVFFIFWEFSLVPMYFLIRLWGGKDRAYAGFKFFVYTMAGSLGLLLSIQIIGLSTGTFDINELYTVWVQLEGVLPVVGLDANTVKIIAYIAFVIAFAIKVPVWPFHTWLPDAHTQAPTAGSMILAGVLLKMGAYGFLRLVVPLFPQQAHDTAWVLALLGMLSIVLGGFAAFGQWDFKRLVAYSSINHMGFVVLGIAVFAWVYGLQYTTEGYRLDAIIATNGTVMQMFNHGLSAAGMFFLVGVIYERTHTRDLKQYGGIWSVLPVFGGILIFVSMASLGLPGLNGFVGEFSITRGAWGIFTFYVVLSMLGLLMTGAYILKGIGSTLHGPLKPEWKGLPSMTIREHIVIWPLMLLMLSLGLWPMWLQAVINDTVTAIFN
ncbi:MAG: NADH-quinone oxidoreductase subunit M [Anaerolineae bacterium]|nr:NADH-quinone oxidoreductase subunit M [Anaerolineae bacterium]MCO5192214.1 NADH-quinone oxidoreductase subunit M [Anaerolineae bacterium]MCO5198352.1 NADH-quinone oxidoreductase subunit M [Anaerolineae bacterium]MCO5204096.1 NADH-quinone oxidoreductase subunit M [Anaerolineae bacterium]